MLWKETRQYFFHAVLTIFTAIDLSPYPHAFTSQTSARFGQKGNRD